MPVEIKELIIRAVTTGDDTTHDPRHSNSGESSQATLQDREAIIQECVRQVLRILQKKAER
jgi:hypothetical protein